ncbi:BON domain-containing protein [Hymenobacter negativus]|uniref:BON domain-containing protein n=1 Tax=Hymenobacter negativus TaxID=2795026 RepID=A0ABS0Q2T9_9BACT|nr:MULTISPECIES: BON domain-containing protein [Bacteria]MBH8556948.1 BON domain-containing protein [Hymenobacter negativus]MBH8569190.1 BON domain-containing protein [Hymenobacter negativus]MBR7208925.1 BON domain-containing protein [Microvirga sp. STS02]
MKSQPVTIHTDEHLADADITAAIELLFMLKKGVTSHLVDVATHDGIVVLSGFTDNLLARERAAEIAKAVRGVRGVVNELVIRTPDVPNAELQRRVVRALQNDPAVRRYQVRSYANDGEVILEGNVQTWAEELLVLRALRGVPGVRHLHNRLVVQGSPVTAADEDIAAHIRNCLAWDLRVKSPLVSVDADHGAVRLTGTVGTAAEFDHVLATAHRAGATSVDAAQLQVAPWALDKVLRHQRYAPKADEDVAQAVRDALRYDPRCHPDTPTVQVEHGTVTLTGAVSNLRARRAAGQDARNVLGVTDVHNQLEVHPAKSVDDDVIRQQVKAALTADAYLTGYHLLVSVDQGRVQVGGSVDSHFDQQRTAEVASGINGVVGLENHVRVAPARAEPGDDDDTADLEGPAADLALEQRIRLHYYWSALLHDQDIEVHVANGRATLTGTVDTWLERQHAAADARDCGARDVNNHLQPLH